MALSPEIEEYVPAGVIEQFEKGTRFLKSDIVTVFDASISAKTKTTPPQCVSDINSFVSDILEPQFYPETAKKLSQTEVRTARKPLVGLRRVTIIGALLGDF